MNYLREKYLEHYADLCQLDADLRRAAEAQDLSASLNAASEAIHQAKRWLSVLEEVRALLSNRL